MNIIKITTDNEFSIHEFPSGDYSTQNRELRKLIGPKCELIEHVMPKRLYKVLGASNQPNVEKGCCSSILIDEEGHFHDLAVNMVGSYLYETDKHGYPIMGTILVIGEYLSGDGIDFSGMSDQQFELLSPKLEELTKKVRNER